jgi:hypothetical protein
MIDTTTYRQLLEITDSHGEECWINPHWIVAIKPGREPTEWIIHLRGDVEIPIQEPELEPLLSLMVRGKPRELTSEGRKGP